MRAWVAALVSIALLAMGVLGAQILTLNQPLKRRVVVETLAPQMRSLESTTVPAVQQAVMDQTVAKTVAIQRSEPERAKQQTVAVEAIASQLEAVASQARGVQSPTALLQCEPQCENDCEALNGNVWQACGGCETLAWARCRPSKRQEQTAPSPSSESQQMANPNSGQPAGSSDRAPVAGSTYYFLLQHLQLLTAAPATSYCSTYYFLLQHLQLLTAAPTTSYCSHLGGVEVGRCEDAPIETITSIWAAKRHELAGYEGLVITSCGDVLQHVFCNHRTAALLCPRSCDRCDEVETRRRPVAKPVETTRPGSATSLVEVTRSTSALVECPKVFIYNKYTYLLLTTHYLLLTTCYSLLHITYYRLHTTYY